MLSKHYQPTSRRAFLQQSGLLLAGGVIGGVAASQAWAAENDAAQPKLRAGLFTDVHYADRAPAGNRYYRESLQKVQEAVGAFNKEGCEVAFELGDLIDEAPDVEKEIGYLRTIDAEYAKFQGKRNYVLGNHCVYSLTKEQFIENSGMEKPYYSFDQNGFHFVVLDGCYRADGVDYGAKNSHWTDTEIPEAQRDWLKADLAKSTLPTIVFVHQRLDLDKDTPAGKSYAIKSSKKVRKILKDSGHVLAVIMGHSHHNFYKELDGIHYCVLRACIEGSGEKKNGYAIADLFADGSIRIRGQREQASYQWS
jgi:UDP-2,3-diacylglucosamine pyrophosphatase LpxH